MFNGFDSRALDFLRDLKANNNKGWFEAHRSDYEQHLLTPLRALTIGLTPLMLSIDQDLATTPGRVISRIHRDTRFSRDKSPYKTCLWLTFKRPVTEWRDTPCWFFEITADSYRYGMGFYNAAKETMDRLRETIERKPEQFRQAVAFLEKQDRFVLEGEMYRRALRPDLQPDLQAWHQRKSIFLVCNCLADKALFSPRLISDLRNGFTLLAPFYDFLWKVKKSAGKQ